MFHPALEGQVGALQAEAGERAFQAERLQRVRGPWQWLDHGVWDRTGVWGEKLEPVCGRKAMIRRKFESRHDVGKTRRYFRGYCKSPGKRRNESLNQDSSGRGDSKGRR